MKLTNITRFSFSMQVFLWEQYCSKHSYCLKDFFDHSGKLLEHYDYFLISRFNNCSWRLLLIIHITKFHWKFHQTDRGFVKALGMILTHGRSMNYKAEIYWNLTAIICSFMTYTVTRHSNNTKARFLILNLVSVTTHQNTFLLI